MGESVIASKPPSDGREWDAQCARCGSSVERVRCDECGGDGWIDTGDYLDDAEVPRSDDCDVCDGDGGWYRCLSTAAWCEAHPIEGRAQVERGAVGWCVKTTVKQGARVTAMRRGS